MSSDCPDCKGTSDRQKMRRNWQRLCEGKNSQLRSTFERLPSDVQLSIFERLTQSQRLDAELVCKSWLASLRSSLKSISLRPQAEDYGAALQYLDSLGDQNADSLVSLVFQSKRWLNEASPQGIKCMFLMITSARVITLHKQESQPWSFCPCIWLSDPYFSAQCGRTSRKLAKAFAFLTSCKKGN